MADMKRKKREITLTNAKAEEIFTRFFAAVKKVMKDEEISMSELSRRSGLSRETLYQYFDGKDRKGRVAYPRVIQMLLLADALKLELDIRLTKQI